MDNEFLMKGVFIYCFILLVGPLLVLLWKAARDKD